MSTSFWVYPCSLELPQLQSIIDVAGAELRKFLLRYSITKDFTFRTGIYNFDNTSSCESLEEYQWNKDSYSINELPRLWRLKNKPQIVF